MYTSMRQQPGANDTDKRGHKDYNIRSLTTEEDVFSLLHVNGPIRSIIQYKTYAQNSCMHISTDTGAQKIREQI